MQWTLVHGSFTSPDWTGLDECACGAELPEVCDGTCPDCGIPYWHLIAKTCDDCGQPIHYDDDYYVHDAGDIVCTSCAWKSDDLALLLTVSPTALYTTRQGKVRAFLAGQDTELELRLIDYSDNSSVTATWDQDDYAPSLDTMLADYGLSATGWYGSNDWRQWRKLGE